ncbi:MAG: hypothetical protein E7Z88_08235 [Cyanobacteria bacterium SIG27]|nr:hypothetical protein [Cyanobacteria bacterium SIG27]
MGIRTNSVDLGAISSSLEARSSDITSQITKAQGMFKVVDSGFDGLDADYLDDGIFNSSKGNILAKSTLTMDKILEMSEEDIEKLLKTAESSDEVQEAIQKQKQLYSQYVQQFKALQDEIKNIESQMKTLVAQVEHAQTEQKEAQDNLADAQKDEKAAQNAYEKAIKEDASANEQAQNEAYKKAQKEYDAQDFSSENVLDFNIFYENQMDDVSTTNSATSSAQTVLDDAASGVNNAQKKFDNQTMAVNRLQNNLLNLETEHKNKQSQMTGLTNNIQQVQTELGALEQKAADVAFIENNKEALQNIAYNKNPEVIATREANGVVFAKTESGNTNPTALNLKEMINSQELALVEKYNIDLDEVVEKDGKYYPKYFIAKGKGDDKFHIYQRSYTLNNEQLAKLPASGGGPAWIQDNISICIARFYDCVPNWDMCDNGNGYLTVLAESDTCKENHNEIYYTTNSDDLSKAIFGNSFKNYSTISPLSFDLNNDGVKTSQSVINFDIDGDGFMDRINDSADAVLVFDGDGDGISGEDGSECFGDNTDIDGDNKKDGYKDGFAALKALAKKEGLINGLDDNMLDENDIRFLEETKGFKIKANGYNSEAQSLLDLGITQINLAQTEETTLINNFDNRGNQLMKQEGATFIQNGEEKEYADIWHKKK